MKTMINLKPAALMLAVMIVFSFLLVPGCGENEAVTPTVSPVEATPAKPPIDIIIYGDFQCLGCERLHTLVESELLQRYVNTGKASMDLRLIATLGPDSLRAAEAALCAADQGFFWDYRDVMFAVWRLNGRSAYSEEELRRKAFELGLDMEAFDMCLESGAKRAEIIETTDKAKAAGVTKVPTVIINDVTIQGNQTLQTYVDIIDDLLSS